MTRIIAAFALALLATTATAHAQSGSIACERELNQTKMQFEANRGALSPVEARNIEQRLSLGESYCASNSYSSASTLIGLGQIRDRLNMVQTAQTAPTENDYQ